MYQALFWIWSQVTMYSLRLGSRAPSCNDIKVNRLHPSIVSLTNYLLGDCIRESTASHLRHAYLPEKPKSPFTLLTRDIKSEMAPAQSRRELLFAHFFRVQPEYLKTCPKVHWARNHFQDKNFTFLGIEQNHVVDSVGNSRYKTFSTVHFISTPYRSIHYLQ